MVSICGSSKVFSSLSELSPWRSARHHKHRFSVNIRGDGQPRPGCAAHDGEALAVARRKKRRTYPELSAQHGRARLVSPRRGGGRQMVSRITCLHQPAGKSQSTFGSLHPVWARKTGVAAPLVLDACLGKRESFCCKRRAGLGSDGATPSTSEVVPACRHLPVCGEG